MAGGRLCDIDGEDCAEVTVDGGGFIDSPELQCRVTAGHFDGARWLPTPTAATLTTPARFVDANRIVCHLGQRHVNATEELDLELEVISLSISFITFIILASVIFFTHSHVFENISSHYVHIVVLIPHIVIF